MLPIRCVKSGREAAWDVSGALEQEETEVGRCWGTWRGATDRVGWPELPALEDGIGSLRAQGKERQSLCVLNDRKVGVNHYAGQVLQMRFTVCPFTSLHFCETVTYQDCSCERKASIPMRAFLGNEIHRVVVLFCFLGKKGSQRL